MHVDVHGNRNAHNADREGPEKARLPCDGLTFDGGVHLPAVEDGVVTLLKEESDGVMSFVAVVVVRRGVRAAKG